ncbi:MAG: tetratricopeptide repeat protein [Polyangiaceae bacterium]|nr:tetratricopeptide repeat protein [Polyangiaceae bacterium]MCW5791390.1 tetratricopeptide repeat protein [Polyangiaceae bacterium]
MAHDDSGPSSLPHSARGLEEPEAAHGATFDGEDFLFHLYRGSELLQDNRVAEAKGELETALAMQPRDIEGQGLLGVVYFRLGMYPHAMEIYEELVRACPDEVTPKINLALCYLKTGQLSEARAALERVIALVPDHGRAWGYLGLVFERLGDHAKAQVAFERAGQPHLARRMQHLIEERTRAPEQPPSQRHDWMQAAAGAAEALEDEGVFSMAGSAEGDPSRSGQWRAIELGQERLPPPSRPFRPPSLTPGRPPSLMPGSLGAHALTPSSARPHARGDAPASTTGGFLPPEVDQLVEQSLLLFREEPGIVSHADGVVLAVSQEQLAVRMSAVRGLVPGGELQLTPVLRQSRGRTLEEAIGEGSEALVQLEGPARLVLGCQSGRLVVTQLEGQHLYLREERVVAFEAGVHHESGRLPRGGGHYDRVLQLSGRGAVVFQGDQLLEAMDCRAETPIWVAADSVVGWTGRLVPRAVDLAEQLSHSGAASVPAESPRLVSFSGDGAVFLRVR